MTLTFDPLVPPALWIALVCAVVGALTWYAWRRPWSVSRRRWTAINVFMAGGAALPLAVLLNPTWQEEIPPPAGKPLLTLLVDATASMSANDMPGGKTRYQAAVEEAASCARELAGRFELRTATFSGGMLWSDPEALAGRAPDGQLTDLATAIADGIALDRPQGQALLLFSDGIHNAGGGTARVLTAVAMARAAAAPIYTRTFGGDAEINDLALRLRSPQQLAFVGQTVPVSAVVHQRGRAPKAVTLVMDLDGVEVARQRTAFSLAGAAEARFPVRQDKPGVYRYEVHVEPFENEVSEVNNYGTFLLRVVDEPIRVLLVEGKPYWDAKFLARTLASDSSVELVSVVRVKEGRLMERTLTRQRGSAAAQEAKQAVPAGEQAVPDAALEESWKILTHAASVLGDAAALATFQVVVLGRDAEVYLTDAALENLRHWIARENGALVCYRGQPTAQVNQRLGRLLPVHWSRAKSSPRFHLRLTERGRDLRWLEALGPDVPGETLARLPTLARAEGVDELKPLATVLATGVTAESDKEVPAVSFQPYGGGRVVVVEGAGMWRWAFLPPAYAEHDDVYGALWQSLLRWLISGAGLLPGQQLSLRADKVTFAADEPATATLLTRELTTPEQAAVVTLEGDGIAEARTFNPSASGEEPGVFRVMFGKLPEGRYRAKVRGPSDQDAAAETAFDVRRLQEEQLDLKSRPDLMARIAGSTGGAALESDSAHDISAQVVGRLATTRPETIRRIPAWDRWWALAGTFLLWSATWGIRRHGGLV
jgi:hypothetical protein